jgi:hypothetical protein
VLNRRRLVALLVVALPASSLMLTQPARAASPPTIAIGDTTVYEGNSGYTPTHVTVTLSDPQAADVFVSYATAAGSATGGLAGSGADYVNRHGRVKLVAGKTSAIVPVSITGDTEDENEETLAVSLTNVTAPGVVLSDATATITIRNDDAADAARPSVAIGDSSVYEGDAGFALVHVSVTLSDPQPATVIFGFATVNGGATGGLAGSGADYVSRRGQIWIGAGKTRAIIAVKIAADVVDDGDEELGVVLTSINAPGVTLSDNTATITILGDEPIPVPPVPGVPDALAAIGGPFPRYLTATWSAPLAGAAVDGYDLEVTRADTTNVLSNVSSPLSFGCGLASVTDTCTLRVRAFNGTGPGDWSDPVTASTWAPPEAPPNLRMLGSNSVAWDEPASDRPISQYWMFKSTNDGLTWTQVTTTTNLYAATTCSICKVRVAAQSEVGIGAYSTIDFAFAPPSPPTSLTVVRDTVFPALLHISWSPPLLATPPVTEYVVTVDDFVSPITMPGITDTRIDIRMRTAGMVNVSVTALNAAGMSTPASVFVPAG